MASSSRFLSKEHKKVMLLSSFGGMLEFYDFVIFAVFATNIGHTFFPSTDPIASVVAAFGVFAIGYIARPIGGIIFSHFGDKYGRKKSFLLSILIMAITTLAMAALPSHQAAGVTMSIIFIALRVLQGMAIGAEIPGAITYVTEHIKNRPGLACGMIFLFINLGIFMADGVHAILATTLPVDIMNEYGWRFAFVFGGILAAMSYVLRSNMLESPAFTQIRNATSRVPIGRLLRNHKKSVLLGTMIISIQATIISMIYLFITSYLNMTHQYSADEIALLTLIPLFIFSCVILFGGWLGDKVGLKPVLISATILFILSVYSFFDMLLTHQYPMIAYIVIAIISGLIIGNVTALLATLFPTKVRYTGIALCYNLAFAIFGGLTPMIATYWIDKTHNMLAPAWVAIIICLFGLIGVFLTKRNDSEAV